MTDPLKNTFPLFTARMKFITTLWISSVCGVVTLPLDNKVLYIAAAITVISSSLYLIVTAASRFVIRRHTMVGVESPASRLLFVHRGAPNTRTFLDMLRSRMYNMMPIHAVMRYLGEALPGKELRTPSTILVMVGDRNMKLSISAELNYIGEPGVYIVTIPWSNDDKAFCLLFGPILAGAVCMHSKIPSGEVPNSVIAGAGLIFALELADVAQILKEEVTITCGQQ